MEQLARAGLHPLKTFFQLLDHFGPLGNSGKPGLQFGQRLGLSAEFRLETLDGLVGLLQRRIGLSRSSLGIPATLFKRLLQLLLSADVADQSGNFLAPVAM